MATHTAQILIGRSHPNDGGIAGDPQYSPNLLLSEGGRPAWVLRPGNWFRQQQDSESVFRRTRKYVLIPTLENALEDGLALLALVLCHDRPWTEPVQAVQAQLAEHERLEMYEIDEETRFVLLNEVRERSALYPKIVLSVFQRDSLVYSQVPALKHVSNT